MGKVPGLIGLCFSASRRAPKGFLYHLFYLAEALVLAKWVKDSGAQHIHAHFGTNAAFVALLVSKLTGVPYSFTIHGPEEFDNPLGLSLPQKVDAAKFVVTISSFGRGQMMRWLPMAAWEKIKIVRCGLDFDDFPEPDPIVEGAPFVFVGRFSEQKGVPLLIQACVKLKQRCPDFRLHMAGGGPFEPMVREQIKTHGLEENITLLGYLSSEDVRKAMVAARALVVTSFAEGLPVVIMEAMACGRPVLSTTINGIPELVADQKNGMLIPSGDADALCTAMESLLEKSAHELNKWGIEARKDVVKHHDIDLEAGRLATAIQEGSAA